MKRKSAPNISSAEHVLIPPGLGTTRSRCLVLESNLPNVDNGFKKKILLV